MPVYNALPFPNRPVARIVLSVILVLIALTLLFPIPRTSRSGSPSSPSTLHFSLTPSHRPNGVIFMLLSPTRITQATMALMNVEDRFNRRLKYPYVLFLAEDELEGAVTEEVRRKVDWITEGRATFATIPNTAWGIPDFLDKSRVDDSLRNIGFSIGYRSMCRYYSGFFYRHPALSKYEWLWRLDTDIEFHCDVPYDPIAHVASEKALYGFVQISDDGSWVQPTLATNVSAFMAQNRQLVPQDANLGFVWRTADGDEGSHGTGIEKALKGEAGNDEWTLKCMYNNFEISHRSIWESELYTRFFKFLDEAGGFFYERWGDSPVHSFALAMLLRKDQVVHFSDLGYQHQGWPYECPDLDRCACVKDGAAVDFNPNADKWFDV